MLNRVFDLITGALVTAAAYFMTQVGMPPSMAVFVSSVVVIGSLNKSRYDLND